MVVEMTRIELFEEGDTEQFDHDIAVTTHHMHNNIMKLVMQASFLLCLNEWIFSKFIDFLWASQIFHLFSGMNFNYERKTNHSLEWNFFLITCWLVEIIAIVCCIEINKQTALENNIIQTNSMNPNENCANTFIQNH